MVEDLDPTAQLVIDGTLLECWSWADHLELYSGKHKTAGLNVQVACTLSGALAWVSDPPRREGPRHRGAAPLWPERRPTPGPTRRSAATVACRRQGLHRTGHDHPQEKTREPAPPPRRQDLQPGRQPDPLQDRKSHRQHQDMKGPAHRLQKTTRHLPRNHHSHPRNHIHIHPMNKPPWLPHSQTRRSIKGSNAMREPAHSPRENSY